MLSTLDLVFTNEEGMLTNLSYLPPLGNSDHVCLRFDFNEVDISSNKYTPSHYKFNSGNYDYMRLTGNTMNDMTSEEAWEFFFDN